MCVCASLDGGYDFGCERHWMGVRTSAVGISCSTHRPASWLLATCFPGAFSGGSPPRVPTQEPYFAPGAASPRSQLCGHRHLYFMGSSLELGGWGLLTVPGIPGQSKKTRSPSSLRSELTKRRAVQFAIAKGSSPWAGLTPIVQRQDSKLR